MYTRVSKDTSGEARSPAEQEAECRAWAEREGWQVVAVESDVSMSASRFARVRERPGYLAARRRLDADDVDLLVCWESSRASRDMAELIALRDACRDAGKRLAYSGRVFDPRRGDDAFMIGLDGLLAEKASAETRDRVLRGVRANAERGRPHGKLLYGYAREYDAAGRYVRTVERPEQAAVVREIGERLLRGHSVREIASDLSDRGIPTSRPSRPGSHLAGAWSVQSVRRIAMNPGYAAMRVHRGEVVGTADWPALISEADHGRLVALLTAPERKVTRPGAARHLITGVGRCGVCGGPVGVLRNRGRWASYCCNTRGCLRTARSQPRVDELVTSVVLARLALPDAASLIVQVDESELRAAEDEAASLRARLDGFIASAAAGELSPATLAGVEARLRPQIAEAERRARPPLPPGAVAELIEAADPAMVWAKLPEAEKRAVVGTLLDSVTILPVGKGGHVFRPESVRITWRGEV